MTIVTSAQGRKINLDAILLNNETTIAVGNMNVNARGDVIGANGEIVKPNNKRIQEFYQKQITPNNAQETI